MDGKKLKIIIGVGGAVFSIAIALVACVIFKPNMDPRVYKMEAERIIDESQRSFQKTTNALK